MSGTGRSDHSRAGLDRDGGDCGGSLTVELVVLSPIVALLGLVGLGLGRCEMVRSQVLDAAHAGAEAAAVAPDETEAGSAAAAAVHPALSADVHACPDPVVTTDTTSFRPGGSVVVTVSCSVPMSDLMLIAFPSSLTVTADSALPIDVYRSIG